MVAVVGVAEGEARMAVGVAPEAGMGLGWRMVGWRALLTFRSFCWRLGILLLARHVLPARRQWLRRCAAPVGADVPTVPAGGQQFVVDGIPYYSVNGVTYRQTTAGYQVVLMPGALPSRVVATPAPAQSTVSYVPAPSTPPPPVAAVEKTTAAEAAGMTNTVFVVNIPTAKGTYTPVALKRSGIGFIGPQGEFYTEFPRIEQLKLMYGK